MLVDFGKANLLEKARQQPDKVRMVIDKMKTDGLMPTLEAVRNKLDQPLPMGYCNVACSDWRWVRGLPAFRWATGWHRTESTRRLCACRRTSARRCRRL